MKLRPTKIVAVGLNYKDHIKEMAMAAPKEPLLFIKPPSALIYNNDLIKYPPQTQDLQYEAELAVIIKDRIRSIKPEEAAEHIWGFT